MALIQQGIQKSLEDYAKDHHTLGHGHDLFYKSYDSLGHTPEANANTMNDIEVLDEKILR
jgi:hypothetical protein